MNSSPTSIINNLPDTEHKTPSSISSSSSSSPPLTTMQQKKIIQNDTPSASKLINNNNNDQQFNEPQLPKILISHSRNSSKSSAISFEKGHHR